jgi:hypothetical protein
MDDKAHPKPRMAGFDRELRRARIFARLSEGYAISEIAREERLTRERVRQIVRQTLDERPVPEAVDHARLQIARLERAIRIAGVAVEDGDVGAIGPYLTAVLALDRYQKAGRVSEVYDGEARRRLFEKLNRVAANLGLATMKEPGKEEAKEGAEGQRPKKQKCPGASAQALEKARLAEAMPSDLLGAAWRFLGLAWVKFCSACGNLPPACRARQLSIFSAAMKASCGMSTLPNWRIFFLPAFCFSKSLRLRVASPP